MIQINDKDFYTLWGAALGSSDQEIYVSEWSTSSIWADDPEELSDAELIDIARYLVKLWDCAHMSVREIYQAAGLSQAALAIKMCIPLRTVEAWCTGKRPATSYTRLAMLRQVGML